MNKKGLTDLFAISRLECIGIEISKKIFKYTNFIHIFIYNTVGKPISVLKSEDPTQEQIDSTHETYIQALKDLYEEYNPIYGDPSVHLKFI